MAAAGPRPVAYGTTFAAPSRDDRGGARSARRTTATATALRSPRAACGVRRGPSVDDRLGSFTAPDADTANDGYTYLSMRTVPTPVCRCRPGTEVAFGDDSGSGSRWGSGQLIHPSGHTGHCDRRLG